MTTPPNSSAAQGRFEKHIERIPFSGCWIWMASTRKNYLEYGHCWHDGRDHIASRLAYELYIGAISEGMYVLHRCDVSLCVNPAHLFIGTQAENMMDCALKGRLNTPRLSAEMVTEIRRRHAAGKSQKELRTEYGISKTLISQVVLRQIWRHI